MNIDNFYNKNTLIKIKEKMAQSSANLCNAYFVFLDFTSNIQPIINGNARKKIAHVESTITVLL